LELGEGVPGIYMGLELWSVVTENSWTKTCYTHDNYMTKVMLQFLLGNNRQVDLLYHTNRHEVTTLLASILLEEHDMVPAEQIQTMAGL
jgi:hypothetical protein